MFKLFYLLVSYSHLLLWKDYVFGRRYVGASFHYCVFVSSSLYPLSLRMLSILKILNSSSESVANSLLQILPNREKTRQHLQQLVFPYCSSRTARVESCCSCSKNGRFCCTICCSALSGISFCYISLVECTRIRLPIMAYFLDSGDISFRSTTIK